MDADRFVTHHFAMDDFEEAYRIFGEAASTGALKVCVTR
jgi:alcohol dehydrogenase